jgi:type II secretory ATPase GspE/PulE/Tfp pilus assembly ATPase PilB-like protein
MTSDLQNLIISNPNRDELSQYLSSHDVKLLFNDGLDRVREQLTTPEEVARVINS